MAHEKSVTVSVEQNGSERFANVDTSGLDKGRRIGGRTYNSLPDAVMSAQDRSTFGRFETDRTGQTAQRPTQRKSPGDKNKPTNPRTKRKKKNKGK